MEEIHTYIVKRSGMKIEHDWLSRCINVSQGEDQTTPAAIALEFHVDAILQPSIPQDEARDFPRGLPDIMELELEA